MADPVGPAAERYQVQTAAVRDRLDGFIARLWASFDEYREPQQREFAAQVVPVVQGAMTQMQALTVAFLAVDAEGGKPVAIPTLATRDVRGVTAAEVYQRPFITVWTALAKAKERADRAGGYPPDGWIDKAIGAGLRGAQLLAGTDVQLAKTHTARAVMAKDRSITGYRRVLEGKKSCGLCVVASTKLYRKSELLPGHAGCDCGIKPVRDAHPDLRLDAATLAAAHESIKQRFGQSSAAARAIDAAVTGKGAAALYRDVLIEHRDGEIGPVISVR